MATKSKKPGNNLQLEGQLDDSIHNALSVLQKRYPTTPEFDKQFGKVNFAWELDS